MNTTITVPRASALEALVPFSQQKALTQLQYWVTTATRARTKSLWHQTDCNDFVEDAKWVLAEAREKHRAKQQNNRKMAEEMEEDDYESEPDWCNDAIVEAEEALRTAKRHKSDAYEACRTNYSEQLRAQKMMAAFLKQHPEYQQVAPSKRKRSAADEANSTRPSKRPRDSTTLPPPTDRASKMETWRSTAKASFKDRAAMIAFPEPVAWPCYEQDCRKQDKSDRALRACECNIKAAFSGLDDKQLKKERHEFHPDRFAVCSEEKREVWQKMATEVFTAISSMLRQEE
ncbi:hypothetical protein LTR85_010548 [Meristemomyces frigidus]|nr:hypothetical protein LTR85_010548 [Meristemomyces frigidus]